MSNNSYQKNGSVGVYNEIPDGESSGGGKKKTLMAAIFVTIVAIGGYYFFHSRQQHSGAAVAKVMEKAGVDISSSGKLKLFDSESMYATVVYIFGGKFYYCYLVLLCLVH